MSPWVKKPPGDRVLQATGQHRSLGALSGSHQLRAEGQQSLGSPGDRGDGASVSQGRVQVSPEAGHWNSSWGGIMCCSALTLALLFARERGQVEAAAHKMQAWAAQRGSRHSERCPRRGWGTLETLQVWVEELTTHTRSCWRGARELAAGLGGKEQREAPKQAHPEGARLGRRWQSLAAMAGGQQGRPSLLGLTQQIPLVLHQGFATRGCSSFDPDLGVLGTGLISTPAWG